MIEEVIIDGPGQKPYQIFPALVILTHNLAGPVSLSR
jgi:hypothetical protein